MVLELAGGAYILTPLYRQRTSMTVPSGTSVIVPRGGNCFVRMPGGSRIQVDGSIPLQAS